jgi:cell division transport system permease protein
MSRKREIEIMRLVGASNINIKLPFIFEGLILGALGSIIPVFITLYGYTALYNRFDGQLFSQFLKLIEATPFVYYVALILLNHLMRMMKELFSDLLVKI